MNLEEILRMKEELGTSPGKEDEPYVNRKYLERATGGSKRDNDLGSICSEFFFSWASASRSSATGNMVMWQQHVFFFRDYCFSCLQLIDFMFNDW